MIGLTEPSRSWRLDSGRTLGGRIAAVCIWLSAASVAGLFLWIVGDLMWQGGRIIGLDFLRESPIDSGRSGGIFPMLVSTLWILAVAMVVSVPFALAVSLWLAEYTRRGGLLAGVVGGSLDLLAATPSIVFGLFGNALFCNVLGLQYSILAGGLTLACMVAPILTRSLEASLKSIPDGYRLAGASLGVSRTRLVIRVLLPCAAPGFAVGLVLGGGRVLAETAALLFTSGYVDRTPRSLMDSGRTLSIHIYDLAMNVPGGEGNAYATAVVLVGILMTLNLLTNFVVLKWLRRRVGGAA